MSNKELINFLKFMEESIKLIPERLKTIQESDELLFTRDGITLPDAIEMNLKIIGEYLKQIAKRDPFCQESWTETEWQEIAKFRDFVSYQYKKVDDKVVYDLCKTRLNMLMEVFQKCRALLVSTQ